MTSSITQNTHVLVCGAGPIGLAAALMLARDGHRVTVLEADPAAAPDTADACWRDWRRSGVTHFRQPHILLARSRQVLDAELPGLTDRLVAAGCTSLDALDPLPPTVADDGPHAGDAALRSVTGRRPVVEAVFGAAAAEEPGVTVRRGVRVAGLLTGPAALTGVPHVTGVVTDAGEKIAAGLVVDATGRRTRAGSWLADLGVPDPLVSSQDRGFVYYTRYFTGPEMPVRAGRPLIPYGSISLLTLEGDNGVWSMTLFGLSGDVPLKALRRNEIFDRVVRALPERASWRDGTPVTDVLPHAGALDRYRRFVVDGTPTVTGFAAVGDAWACTNPSVGRGISMGLVHAQQLRHTVAAHLGDPAGFARAWDETTEDEVAPFFHEQTRIDTSRVAEMDAYRLGAPPPAPNPGAVLFATAFAYDPVVWRAYLEVVYCLATLGEVLGRPEIKARLGAYVDTPPPPPSPGPDRGELLTLLAG